MSDKFTAHYILCTFMAYLHVVMLATMLRASWCDTSISVLFHIEPVVRFEVVETSDLLCIPSAVKSAV
jgi:hypothetical protein